MHAVFQKVLEKTKSHEIIFAAFILILFFLFLIFFIPHKLISKTHDYSYVLYDRNDVLLGAQVAKDEQWRFEKGKVSKKFEQAIVQYEDKRFYYHFGIDFFSIARAVRLNAREKRIVSGGSTITMQTIRLLEENPKRTYRQKIKEALLAILFELRFSKKQILSLYCENAPFGGNVVGLEAASWRYFNRPPEELSWAETAVLAVLPNQPSLVYPGVNSQILQKKRDALLHRLFEKKIIDEKTYKLSLLEKLPEKPYPLAVLAPHYLEYLKSHSNGRTTKFHTALDFNLQKNTSRILERRSNEFHKMGIDNAACLILDTRSKNVLAYCGNTGINSRNINNFFVDIIQSKRSSGSLLKPFLYAAMLDSGELLPNQLVIDIPTRIGNYRPDNNIPKYSGAVPASQALTRSLNIPAIRELQAYGINRFLDILKKCGFSTLNRTSDEYGLPLILGGGEITMMEAARAYASMMNKACGQKEDFPISTGSCYITMDVLSTGTRPDDEANWQKYANSKKIAWKTGTSNGNRDAWAIGVTKDYTVAVWIGNAGGGGNPDLKSVSTSAPLLFDIFSILPNSLWPEVPFMELKRQTVCTYTGFVAGQHCTQTKECSVPKNSPIGQLCPYCRSVSLTSDEKFQATVQDLSRENAGIYYGQIPKIEKRFVLPPALEYWYKKTDLNYKSLPDFVSWHSGEESENISIIFPSQNTNVIIPVELDGSSGSMVMQAAVRSNETSIFWDLDGVFIGETKHIHELKTQASPGAHILTVTDSMGNMTSRKFTIVNERE